MRVLLVQSYLGRHGFSDHLVFPIGPSCAATALHRAGHEPRIVDLNATFPDDGPAEVMARLAGEIAAFRPDVVGVSLRNIDSTTRRAPFVFHTWLRPTLEVIRREAPAAPAILGGPGFTQAAAGLMARHPFDLGVQGEAEEALVELLDHLDHPEAVPGTWFRDADGRPRFAGPRPPPDFATLPPPRRDFVDWDRYRRVEAARRIRLDVGVESTRGCPFGCAYCNYPRLNGRHLRRKPPAVVADEVQELVARFDVRHFSFTDSRFAIDRAHARAICEELRARRLPVTWAAWLGPRQADPELLGAMHAAGCRRVGFSADGLLRPSLERMGKDATARDIARSVDAVRRVPGLRASWSFFCTPPSTSHREQLALLAAWAGIHAAAPGRTRALLTWCRVEEGTAFERIAREDGVLPADADLLPDTPEALARLFYVAPGFEGWSWFWDRLLDAELAARVAAGRLARRLRRAGVRARDLTPGHLRGTRLPAAG